MPNFREFRAVKPMPCHECGKRIEAGERHGYMRLRSGAEVAVCMGCLK